MGSSPSGRGLGVKSVGYSPRGREGLNVWVINPRRGKRPARVTVVVLRALVCLSVVCYHVFFLCTQLSGQVATRTASE